MTSKVVIAGGSGALGRRLVADLADKCDVVVLTRMRLPNVSDASLPTEAPADRAPGVELPTVAPEDRAPGRHHLVRDESAEDGPAEGSARS